MSGGRWRALLIESDEPYRAVIKSCLRLAGCEVEELPRPDLALPALERDHFDLVVWGISPPEPNRLETISRLRAGTKAALVVVDGSPEVAQLNLETGADQWLPKPFVPGSLVAATGAALRRSGAPMAHLSKLEIRGMLLDGRRRQLTFRGREVLFTRQEWSLLSILVSHPDCFLAAREILRLGWQAGDHAAEELRTYASRLRRKLGPLDLPCRLESRHGQGYALIFD